MVDIDPLDIYLRSEPYQDAGRWSTCFFSLLVCSLILACTLILTVILSKHLHRLNTWIAFISSIIVFCVTFILLPVSGYSGAVQPPFAFCLFQASLVSAAYPLVASTGACFMMEVYYIIYISLRDRPRHSWIQLLLWLPPFVYLVIFSVGIWIGGRSPERVLAPDAERDVDIARCCRLDSKALSYSMTVYFAIAGSSMAMTSAYTAGLVYSNWREYKELTGRPGSQVKTNPDVFSLSILIRLALFFIVIVVAVCLDASTQTLGPMTEGKLIWGIMVGSVPLATVLIFGTHRDMMRTWASWLRIYTWC